MMHTILIVDDDKLIRWSLNELFSQQGCSVDVAATTEEALHFVNEQNYNLIIADYEIDHEDGHQMLNQIRSIQPETRIIILSALSPQQIESKLADFSVYTIIEKPFRSEEISAVAKKALSISSSVPDTDNHIDPKIN